MMGTRRWVLHFLFLFPMLMSNLTLPALRADAASCLASEAPTAPIVVEDLDGVNTLRNATNCTGGGTVEAIWYGSVEIDATLIVGSGTVLVILGTDEAAVVGSSSLRVFEVEPGGGLNLSGLVIFGGSAKEGGAILSTYGTVAIEDCGLLNNVATSGGGGAISATRGNVTISRSNFQNNSASTIGGAIYANDVNLSVYNSSSFESNWAVEGGAIFCAGLESSKPNGSSTSSCSLDGSTFVNNNASDTVPVDFGMFEAPWVGLYGGGAVSIVNTAGIMRDCRFDSNSAQVSGGGVFVGEGGAADVEECTFVNNTTGGYGGAASVATAMFAESTLFLENKSGFDGAAVFAWDSQGNVDLVDVTCEENVAGGKGGCMYTAGAAIVREEVVMRGNVGESGGCLYVTHGGNATILGGNYTCTSTGNGGFLFASNGGIANIMGGWVTGCLAMRRAGAVYCSGDDEDLIGAEVTISGGTFKGNKAEELGGALVAWGTTVTVLGGIFEDNYARFFGGFLFLEEQASLSCDGGIIRGNYAGDQGGGVYAREATWVNMTGCDIVTNIAPQGSGAYLTQVQSTQLQDMAVTADEDSAGSLVFIRGSNVTARNVTFGAEVRSESFLSNYAVESDSVTRFRGDGCTFDSWNGGTVVYHAGRENHSLVLNGCDFRGSSSSMMVLSSDADAVIRNAKVGELSFSNALDTRSLVDRALSCESPGVCGEGDCVDSPLGVLCECLPETDGGMCLEDGPTLSLGVETPPPNATYSPDSVEFELYVSADYDGSTDAVWELTGISDTLELELTPSSGILSPGEKTMVGISGTPADSNIGGLASSRFVLTTVTDGESVVDDATSFINEERTTVELLVVAVLYQCDAFAVAIPDEANETAVTCELCSNLDGADGLDCADPGATLATLPIRSGFWRSDTASITVHSCENPGACVGGTRVNTSDDYCRKGYEGPYCAVCSEGYGRSWGDECRWCDDGNAKALVVLTSAFFVGVVGLIALAVVYLLGGLDAVDLLRASIASSFKLGGSSVKTQQGSVGTEHRLESAREEWGIEVPGLTPAAHSDVTKPNVGPPQQGLISGSWAEEGTQTERVVHQAAKADGDAVENSGSSGEPERSMSPLITWGNYGVQGGHVPPGRRDVDGDSDGEFRIGGSSSFGGCREMVGVTRGDHRRTKRTGERSGCFGWGATIKSLLSRLPLDKLKILVVVWQILAAFPSIAAVRYPPVYATFLSWIDFINFDLGRILSSSCLFPNTSHYERLLVATLGPLVLMLVLMCTYQIAMKRAGSGPAGVNARRAASSRHMAACLMLTFVVFTSASSTIFRTFACDDEAVAGKRFLRADYSISCDTRQYTIFTIYAGVMIMVYPLGIPLFYFHVLWKNRNSLNPNLRSMKPSTMGDDVPEDPPDEEFKEAPLDQKTVLERKIEQRRLDPSLMPTVFLWKDVVPELYYFEVIECGRRILLTGVLIFIGQYSPTSQVSLACILAFVNLVAFELMRPYVDPNDNWLYRLGCIIIFLNNYLGLLIKTRAAGDGRLDALGVPIVLVNLALVVAVIITSWFATQQNVESSLAEDNSLSVARSMITTEHSLGKVTRERRWNKASQKSFDPAHRSPDGGDGGGSGVSPATARPVPDHFTHHEWCGGNLGVGPRSNNAQGALCSDPSNSANVTIGQEPSREGRAKDVGAV